MDLLSVFFALCCLCHLVCSAAPRMFALSRGYLQLAFEVLRAMPFLLLLRVKVLVLDRQDDVRQHSGMLISVREQGQKLNQDVSNTKAAIHGQWAVVVRKMWSAVLPSDSVASPRARSPAINNCNWDTMHNHLHHEGYLDFNHQGVGAAIDNLEAEVSTLVEAVAWLTAISSHNIDAAISSFSVAARAA